LTKVEYSKHALEKMRVREVSKRQMGVVIRNPDFSYQDVESNALVAVKKRGERHVVGIFTLKDERVRVVTVYHASEVDRLIRRKLQRGVWLVKR
jgi:hypothetical protein